jgi:hypothetical protein
MAEAAVDLNPRLDETLTQSDAKMGLRGAARHATTPEAGFLRQDQEQ